eukprot:820327-Pyramimonas_sp.AAC.1
MAPKVCDKTALDMQTSDVVSMPSRVSLLRPPSKPTGTFSGKHTIGHSHGSNMLWEAAVLFRSNVSRAKEF